MILAKNCVMGVVRGNLAPSYAAAGNNMATSLNTHAQMIILCTVETWNVRGTARVDKYFSRLITARLFTVITEKMKFAYRTILHAQPP